MMYNHEIELLTVTVSSSYPQVEERHSSGVILCHIRSTTRSEFFAGGADGMRPELIAVINRYDYNGEKIAVYDGAEYAITRTYDVNTEEIELTLEKKVGGRSGKKNQSQSTG